MTQTKIDFSILNLRSSLIKALNLIGYKTPSPIQLSCIPQILKGFDVLGMAQTGSGKTAAFALPFLNKIDEDLKFPQILVLTPTRELAVQVAQSFTDLSRFMFKIKVVALYGGQRYENQLRILRYGPQIVVGTPGRLLDHLKRKTLVFSSLTGVVLDEADEMLRMGFIEDVETIMAKIPKPHQTALFSATMPEAIKRITRRFMKNPKEISIKSNIHTKPDINQRYWIVHGRKTDALVRFLEIEDFSATIIFVRTKNATLEVSEALEKNGYNSAALNGDMNQSLREKTLERLKNGNLDILIATDVAARGLDVDRISLVINYDIPMDVESYVHRIGRTGRAGRKGKALLFVENRERRLLRNIERTIQSNMIEVRLPNVEILGKRRLENFSKKLELQLKSRDLDKYCDLLSKINPEKEKYSLEKLSAALLKMAQGERTLIVKPIYFNNNRKNFRLREKKNSIKSGNKPYKLFQNSKFFRKKDMDTYRIEVGRKDGVEVRHIVGAIANEGKMNSRNIGNIKLFLTYSTIELPKEMSYTTLSIFSKTRILNKPINIKLIRTHKYKKNQNYKTRFNNNPLKKKIN